jgi:Anti-sigma-D factor RsdA to sigma factor binding region
MEALLVRSGDIGDEAGRPAADAGPLDLDAVRADDDLIEALAAGLVPPPSGPRDTSDIEGELVALLAGWVADVRPETLLHRPPPCQVAPLPVAAESDAERTSELTVVNAAGAVDDEEPGRAAPVLPARSRPLSLLEYDDVTQPVLLSRWRSSPAKPYVLRAAAALIAVALVGSGVIVRSYDARPGEALWTVAQMVFPAKSHSVEASISVSTALNTARVALERGRVDEAREAFQTVAAQLADVDDADGRAELNQQMDYVHAQLVAAPASANPDARTPGGPRSTLAVGAAGAVIPSSPAVTPGANAALATTLPPSPSSALAAAPAGTSDGTSTGGRPATDGTPSAPAVVAAPAPSGDSVSPPPVVSAPPDVSSPPDVSGPPVAPPPANPPPVVENPPASVPTTTDPPAPTTDPPTSTAPPPDSVAPQQPAGDPGTQDASSPAANNDPATAQSNNATDSSGTGGANTDSAKTDSQSNTDTSSPAADGATADAAGVSIDTAGAAGSTLGEVTGVVTNTASS